jgi:hypothetical protein
VLWSAARCLSVGLQAEHELGSAQSHHPQGFIRPESMRGGALRLALFFDLVLWRGVPADGPKRVWLVAQHEAC